MVTRIELSESTRNARGVLYIIACASTSAILVPNLVIQAQIAGWEVCVITTPQGTKFLDIPLLEQLTGYPVRSEYKRPEEPDVLPRADAIVVFPATFNTINKWALAISDTLAVGILCEYTGLKMPIVAVPCFRTGGGLDGHPAFFRSLQMLRDYGIRVLYEPEIYPPKNQVPPDVILEVLGETIGEHAQRSDTADRDSY
jgi:Flavoprotein